MMTRKLAKKGWKTRRAKIEARRKQALTPPPSICNQLAQTPAQDIGSEREFKGYNRGFRQGCLAAIHRIVDILENERGS